MQLILYMNNYLIFEKFQSGFRSNIALRLHWLRLLMTYYYFLYFVTILIFL